MERRRQRQQRAQQQRQRWRRDLFAAACIAAAALIPRSLAAHIVYDETSWTKQEWPQQRIDPGLWRHLNPADDAIKDPDILAAIKKAKWDSLDGPSPRRATTTEGSLSLWGDGAAAAAPGAAGGAVLSSMDAVEHAAAALACPVCHALTTRVWASVAGLVRARRPVNEVAVRDLLEDACAQGAAPDAVAREHTLRRVEAGAGPMTAAVWFVARKRADGSAPTRAEAAAAARACNELVTSSLGPLSRAVMDAARSFFSDFNAAIARHDVARARARLADEADDEYADPDEEDEDDEGSGGSGVSGSSGSSGLRAGEGDPEAEAAAMACRDEELMCASWAAVGECRANPNYMVGGGRHRGHCELSCGVCQPDESWRSSSRVSADLTAAELTAGVHLRAAACAATTKACLAADASSTVPGAGALRVEFVEREPDTTPGALLRKLPGFVLGKPFFGSPPRFAATPAFVAAVAPDETAPLPNDAVDAALHADFGNVAATITGMDGYFRYGLLYRRAAFQYHRDPKQPDRPLTEKYLLGTYDAAATRAAAEADARAPMTRARQAWLEARRAALGGGSGSTAAGAAAGAAAAGGADSTQAPLLSGDPTPPPMLEPLDLIPDRPAMMLRAWPYARQVYSRGDACGAADAKAPRRVELRAACAPDDKLTMLVREPEFCTYILVVYSPRLCAVPGYEPVRFLPAPGAAAAAAAAAVGAGAAAAAAPSGVQAAAAAAVKGAPAGTAAAAGGAGGDAKAAAAAADGGAAKPGAAAAAAAKPARHRGDPITLEEIGRSPALPPDDEDSSAGGGGGGGAAAASATGRSGSSSSKAEGAASGAHSSGGSKAGGGVKEASSDAPPASSDGQPKQQEQEQQQKHDEL